MQKQLQHLLNRFIPAPEEWFVNIKPVSYVLEPIDCDNWTELVDCWQKALVGWKDPIDITLSSMLATVTSTPLQGDQLWLRAIGLPGTAKTTLCEALGTNKNYCKHLSILTGLHSGYRDESGEDFSLIDRMNRRTAIINEGDVLMKAANKDSLLAQWRDIYSGFTNADYRNQAAKSYEGLRMTMILAGTPKIRAMNTSALGDRFLDCVIYEKQTDVEESRLVKSVLKSNRLRVITESDGQPESYDNPEKILAKQKTAGYINWLRANGVNKLRQIMNDTPEEQLDRMETDCEMLGRLVAYMRTRAGVGDEDQTEKELHIRLAEQLRKLALCTAVVMNRGIDAEVMRRTTKVAFDTCYGNTFAIVKVLQGKSLDAPTISTITRKTQDSVRKSLGVLYQLEAVRIEYAKANSGALNRNKPTYRLSLQTQQLMGKLKSLSGITQ